MINKPVFLMDRVLDKSFKGTVNGNLLYEKNMKKLVENHFEKPFLK